MSARSVEMAVNHFCKEIENNEIIAISQNEFEHTVRRWGLFVVFYPEKIMFDGAERMGLQNGNSIDVYFPGCFSDSAFFHELGHFIREAVWHEWLPDMEHQDLPFWEIMDRKIPEGFRGNFYDCIDRGRCFE